MMPAPAVSPDDMPEESRGPRRAVFASNDAALPQARDLAARLVSGSPDPAVAVDDGCALFARCTVDKLAAIPPAEWFVTLWIAVTLTLLVRLALGAVAAHRLVRRARPVTDASWLQLLKDGCEMAGVEGKVRLYESTAVGMPVTLGVLRPTIVLPPHATAWSEERRLTVLVHELAHVRRNDVATCLVARIACALHWLNPLVWRAARKLRDECERACDDLVLRAGMTASTYADDLLDIVRNAGISRSPAVALPMAQRSDFEGRLLAILEPARRRAPSTVRSLAMATVVLAIALPLAAMAPAPMDDMGDSAVMTIADDEVGMGKAHEKAIGHTADEGRGAGSGLGKGVASAVGSVLDDLGIDLGEIKTNVTAAVGNAASAAKAYVEEKAFDLVAQYPEAEVVQVPEPPQPSQSPQKHQRGNRRQHSQADQREYSDSEDRAVFGLSEALVDGSAQVRLAAAEGLGGLEDPRAVEALSRALRTDENVEVRRMAAWALGEIEDAAAVPALSDALRSDRDEEVRRMAAWALGEIESATAVEALGAALRDQSVEVRKTAVWALGEIESPNGVQYLIPFLRDENAQIRGQAAWALGEIESPRAVEALNAALDDSDPKIREMVVWALGEIEDAAAVEGLSKALKDANVGVRRKAAWAIGELDLNETAPRALIEATRDSDREVRKIAAHALGEIADPAAVPALSELARGQDNAVRYAAIHALTEIEDPSSFEVLVELLKDSDPEVRKLAAQALGKH
jgi:HEAT repeat protein/beta-lactamase regulating signal transducer with metallopeptidase domain